MQCNRCGSSYILDSLTSTCSVCGSMTLAHKAKEPLSTVCPVELIPLENTNRSKKPLIALIDTILECLFKPYTFFSKIKNSTNLLAPIIFSLTLGSIGTLSSLAWSHLIPEPFFKLSNSTIANSLAQESIANSLILSPFFLIAGNLLISTYIHVILMIFRKCQAPFLMTFRAVCYSECSAIFLVVPWIGGFFSLFSSLYFILTGIKVIHSISRTKSLLFFLIIPAILITGLMVILLIFVLGTLAGNNLLEFFSFFKT